MIEDPPLLSIRRNFPRPSSDIVNAFKTVPTGFVVDCMAGRGGLDFEIKAADPQHARFVGVALTCAAGPADNLAMMAAIHFCQPGDVIMVSADSFTATCVTGDLLVGMAKNQGAVAVVTDGLVRDLEGILEVGLPVFSRGITPNSCARNGPGSVGEPITIGDVAVASGDIVVGDDDGVVVIPQSHAKQVIWQLEQVKAAEANLTNRVKAGMKVGEIIGDLLESDRVKYLD